MLAVAVPTHEELCDEFNQMYTVYNVEVEREVNGKVIAWNLRKRYSAFAELHRSLSPRYEKELVGFQFPNKSMFNTYATFTKDRRKSGFEELLKVLIRIDPLPVELEDFLEIDDHVHDNQRPTFLTRSADERTKTRRIKPSRQRKKEEKDNESESKTVVGEGRSSFLQSNSVGNTNNIDNRGSDTAGVQYHDESIESPPSPYSLNSIKQMILCYGKLFLVILITYTVCVLVGLIDVSSTTWDRMLLTVLALEVNLGYIAWVVKKRCPNLKNLSVFRYFGQTSNSKPVGGGAHGHAAESSHASQTCSSVSSVNKKKKS